MNWISSIVGLMAKVPSSVALCVALAALAEILPLMQAALLLQAASHAALELGVDRCVAITIPAPRMGFLVRTIVKRCW